MKKILTLCFAALLAVGITACKQSNNQQLAAPADQNAAPAQQSTQNAAPTQGQTGQIQTPGQTPGASS